MFSIISRQVSRDASSTKWSGAASSRHARRRTDRTLKPSNTISWRSGPAGASTRTTIVQSMEPSARYAAQSCSIRRASAWNHAIEGNIVSVMIVLLWLRGQLIEGDLLGNGQARLAVEPGDFEAPEVLAHLLRVDERHPGHADLDVGEASAGENRAWLGWLRLEREGEHRLLAEVEYLVDLRRAVGMALQEELQVLHAVRHVASLVLHAQAEDRLLDLGRGQEFSFAEERQHEPFAEDVHEGAGGRVVGSLEDRRQQLLLTRRRHHEAAAVGERALAEDVEMARLVDDLGREEELHLVEVVIDPTQPLGGHVAGDELDLREAGAHLADGALDVVGKLLELVPRDVGHGVPLAHHRLVVEQPGVVDRKSVV